MFFKNQTKEENSMKKVMALIFVIVMVFGLTGCRAVERQEALLDYINNDVAELGTIEEELLASYESVSGENYTDDLEMYTEFTSNTSDLARNLNEKAVEIAEEITDEEILEVHRLYMNYSNKFMSVINLMISALENQDITLAVEANEKLNEANNYALDFRKALSRLAEKRDVEFK